MTSASTRVAFSAIAALFQRAMRPSVAMTLYVQRVGVTAPVESWSGTLETAAVPTSSPLSGPVSVKRQPGAGVITEVGYVGSPTRFVNWIIVQVWLACMVA